ncbi:hypothetical protein OESDEN_09380 [Oesophagostomum dentatum]|uniref:Carnitine/acylcarnitine carrier protein CACL n=1 Tax=Oesophagostomum dentatum TaxID=61180 RepID=A0A0B1T3P5_OESDE|nr:hypothetical protein OESDEN_09380 [Oesophagostomum dentatum]
MSAIDFFAGCVGGAAGVLAGHPLDTVKVRLQMQRPDAKVYRGTWHCFKTIIRKEGFAGLYKGDSIRQAGRHPTVAQLTRVIDIPSIKKLNSLNVTLATPSERLKLLIQIQTDNARSRYQSPLHAARSLVATQGLGTLTRGFWATLIRDCPAFGIYFASYEWMSRSMSKDGKMESLTGPQLLLAGGAAGMLSWLFNYPSDVVKTRFQANDNYRSYWHCIQSTYREGGLRMFYTGLGSTLIRAFPSNAATFFAVEWTYRLLVDFNLLGTQAEIRIQVDECPVISDRLRHFLPLCVHASAEAFNEDSQNLLFVD